MWQISVETDAGNPATIPLGEKMSANVTVTLRLTGVVCQGGETTTVTLGIGAGVTGITATLPATVEVTLPRGSGLISTGTGEGVAIAPLAITVAKLAPADHDHSYEVKATAPATLPTGCQSTGTPAAAEDTANVAIKTGPELVAPTSSSSSGPAPGKASPGAPLLFLLGALALAAVARRRE